MSVVIQFSDFKFLTGFHNCRLLIIQIFLARIPDKDGPKRKYGFVDFDDFDAVDLVITQREHYINGHR